MVRKNTFVILAMVAILFLQFADCMSEMTMDQQSMQCCGSMPCDPSNQSHDCCKSMASSSQSPSVLPVAHVTLHPPMMDVADILPTPQVLELSDALTEFAAPQHSPPELYTLHSSFLI